MTPFRMRARAVALSGGRGSGRIVFGCSIEIVLSVKYVSTRSFLGNLTAFRGA